MGEHVSCNCFRIADLTIQIHGGALASFVRAVRAASRSLMRFFRRTGRRYRVFNYLGEWHSHPSFTTEASTLDISSMLDIVGDAELGARFALLLIVKLAVDDVIRCSAIVFLPDSTSLDADVVLEEEK